MDWKKDYFQRNTFFTVQFILARDEGQYATLFNWINTFFAVYEESPITRSNGSSYETHIWRTRLNDTPVEFSIVMATIDVEIINPFNKAIINWIHFVQ